MRASRVSLTALFQKGWKASFHFNTQEETIMSQERFKYPQRQECCLPTFKKPRFTCHDEPRCWAKNRFSSKRDQAEWHLQVSCVCSRVCFLIFRLENCLISASPVEIRWRQRGACSSFLDVELSMSPSSPYSCALPRSLKNTFSCITSGGSQNKSKTGTIDLILWAGETA